MNRLERWAWALASVIGAVVSGHRAWKHERRR